MPYQAIKAGYNPRQAKVVQRVLKLRLADM
jgi:hypothetical protein